MYFNCEICGNHTYRGPKAFQRHFAVSEEEEEEKKTISIEFRFVLFRNGVTLME